MSSHGVDRRPLVVVPEGAPERAVTVVKGRPLELRAGPGFAIYERRRDATGAEIEEFITVVPASEPTLHAGTDVVTDGEQGKASFFGYIVERFNGFARTPAPTGQEGNPRTAGREYRAFPDYYAWSERIAEWAGGRGGDRRHGIDVCTGPVSYKGHAAVQRDIENIKTALKGLPHEEVFMPAIAPSYLFATLTNKFYRTEEEYEQ